MTGGDQSSADNEREKTQRIEKSNYKRKKGL